MSISEITNLGFAAFLMMRQYKLIESPTIDKDKRFIFKFEIEDNICKKLFYEYSTGDFAKFDSCIVNLKRMLPRY